MTSYNADASAGFVADATVWPGARNPNQILDFQLRLARPTLRRQETAFGDAEVQAGSARVYDAGFAAHPVMAE